MVTNFHRKSSVVWRWMAVCLLAVVIAAPMETAAQMTFSRIVVFGDSLSDPGNDFALIKTQNTPPYDNIDPWTRCHSPRAVREGWPPLQQWRHLGRAVRQAPGYGTVRYPRVAERQAPRRQIMRSAAAGRTMMVMEISTCRIR